MLQAISSTSWTTGLSRPTRGRPPVTHRGHCPSLSSVFACPPLSSWLGSTPTGPALTPSSSSPPFLTYSQHPLPFLPSWPQAKSSCLFSSSQLCSCVSPEATDPWRALGCVLSVPRPMPRHGGSAQSIFVLRLMNQSKNFQGLIYTDSGAAKQL